MSHQAAGFQWLKDHFSLQCRLTHRSYIGSIKKTEVSSDGCIIETYGPKYAPSKDTAYHHLEFGLKYDNLSLDFLLAVFKCADQQELMAFIKNNPGGRYARRIGFIYEWLTGQYLNMESDFSGNYVDLIDGKKYVTGSILKNSRWRINDNLLGGPEFCPVVRKNIDLSALLSIDFHAKLKELKEEYSPEIFNRAAQYLYRKETRSSFEIEKENPTPDRINRFIELLYNAGKIPANEVLTEKNLTLLQNA
ncbi:MAG: hypothetical protein RBS33_15070, partial [Lentimicrobium sp.]|nr:hypothetical protein [Lentimicrobium sp.]